VEDQRIGALSSHISHGARETRTWTAPRLATPISPRRLGVVSAAAELVEASRLSVGNE